MKHKLHVQTLCICEIISILGICLINKGIIVAYRKI